MLLYSALDSKSANPLGVACFNFKVYLNKINIIYRYNDCVNCKYYVTIMGSFVLRTVHRLSCNHYNSFMHYTLKFANYQMLSSQPPLSPSIQ